MTSTQANIQITDPKLGTFVVPYISLAERFPLFLLEDEAQLPECIDSHDATRYKAALAATATVIQQEQMLNDLLSGRIDQTRLSKGPQCSMLRKRLAETKPTPTLGEFAANYAKVLLDVECLISRYDVPTSRKDKNNTMSVIKLGHAPATAAAMSGYGWVRKSHSPDEIAGALADAFEAELER